MKKIITGLFLTVNIFTATAQNSGGRWQELSALEEVTTKVISASKDGEKDIIKRASAEFYFKATDIAKSNTAHDFEQNEKMKKAIAQLVKQTKELAEKAKSSADDGALKTMMAAVNTTLQDIDEQYKKAKR